MGHSVKVTLGRYIAGELTDIQAKAEILKLYPGYRTQHDALLLADYVDELLAQALADSQAIVEAFDKLKASEASDAA
jgi:hypothetical protein